MQLMNSMVFISCLRWDVGWYPQLLKQCSDVTQGFLVRVSVESQCHWDAESLENVVCSALQALACLIDVLV
jgi:hypothetical protein